MKFIADITILPLKELLDPQGKTITSNLPHIGINGVIDVRVGKHIVMNLEADNEATANSIVDESCKKLLSNQIMENYTFSIRHA
jgi:phosphoribosylformylglycinamidine synthase